MGKKSRRLALFLAGLALCGTFYLYIQDGVLWVRDPAGETRSVETLSPRALPSADRERLTEGVAARTLPELTAMLEDLGP